MSKLLLILLIPCLIFIGSCKTKSSIQQEDTSINIETVYPKSPQLDSLKIWCSISFTDLEITPKSESKNKDSFSYNNVAFEGWACQTFDDNAHRYRFYQIINGKVLRQVSYYVNGVLDSDFYMDWTQGHGTERMWMADGKPYIENYYSAPNTMHGLQRRWYSNNILAKEALYDKGVLIYLLEYNKQGELILSKGVPPNRTK